MKESALINRFIAFLPEEFIMLGDEYYCTKIFYKEGRKNVINRNQDKDNDSLHVKTFKKDVEELISKKGNERKFYWISEFPILIKKDLYDKICDAENVPKNTKEGIEIRSKTHYKIDFFFPYSKTFVEIDGSHHDSESAKLDDRVRDRYLNIVFGQKPLRFYQYGIVWKWRPGVKPWYWIENPNHEQQKIKLIETIESRYNKIPLRVDQTKEMINILCTKYKKEIDVINLIEKHYQKEILWYDNNTKFKVHLSSVVPESKNPEKDKREIKNFFKKFFQDKGYDIEIL